MTGQVRSTSAALIVCLAMTAGTAAAQTAPPDAIRETLLMPFESAQPDSRAFWLGEGSAVLLSDFFELFGAATIPRDSRIAAFERLQLPPATALSHATVIKVAQFVGASEIVVGSYELAGDELTVRARTMTLDAGRLTPAVVERGPLNEVVGVYERVARRLRDATTGLPPHPAGALLGSPQALEMYIKGLVAETSLTQRTFLEQALKLAPRENRIRLALWQVHTDLGDHGKALDVVSAVGGGRHVHEASYLAALSNIELKRYDVAFAALNELADARRDAEVFNALGVVQLLRGGSPQTGKPAYYFNQAAQTDPTDPDYFFNLGYAYWLDRDPPAAVYWLREAVRRDPTDGDAHYVLAAALQQTNAAAESAREKELALKLSSSYAEWDKRAAAGGEAVPRGLHRLKDRIARRGVRVESIITSSGQRDQAELAAFHLESGRRAFEREADRQAEQELRRAIFLSPYLADAHLLLGRVHLRSGRTADAVQEFKIALWSSETVAGRLALAEAYLQSKDAAAATAEVERALVLDPDSADAKELRDRIARAKL